MLDRIARHAAGPVATGPARRPGRPVSVEAVAESIDMFLSFYAPRE